jgi:hypothetical protein
MKKNKEQIKTAPRVFEVQVGFDFPLEGGQIIQLEPGDLYEPEGDIDDVIPVEPSELPVDVQPELMVASYAHAGHPQAEVAKQLTAKFGMTESQALRTTELCWPSTAMSESIFRKGTSAQGTKAIRFDDHSPKN